MFVGNSPGAPLVIATGTKLHDAIDAIADAIFGAAGASSLFEEVTAGALASNTTPGSDSTSPTPHRTFKLLGSLDSPTHETYVRVWGNVDNIHLAICNSRHGDPTLDANGGSYGWLTMAYDHDENLVNGDGGILCHGNFNLGTGYSPASGNALHILFGLHDNEVWALGYNGTTQAVHGGGLMSWRWMLENVPGSPNPLVDRSVHDMVEVFSQRVVAGTPGQPSVGSNLQSARSISHRLNTTGSAFPNPGTDAEGNHSVDTPVTCRTTAGAGPWLETFQAAKFLDSDHGLGFLASLPINGVTWYGLGGGYAQARLIVAGGDLAA